MENDLKEGDWVLFHDEEDTPDLVGQVIEIDDIIVRAKFYDPEYHYAVATVNKYYLTKITKEVADIIIGV
jgi:hypothetical protein